MKESWNLISSVYLFLNPLKETQISGNLSQPGDNRVQLQENSNEQLDRR